VSGVVERYGEGDWRWTLYVRWMWVCSVSSLKEWREEDGGGQGSKGKSWEDCMLGVSFSFGIPSPPAPRRRFASLCAPDTCSFPAISRASTAQLSCSGVSLPLL